MPGFRHNPLLAAQLSARFEHPMQLWPRASVFRCPCDAKFVVFRKSAQGVFEATVRRSAIVYQAPAKSLVAAKPMICNIMACHRLAICPGKDITRRTVLQLTGKGNACENCSEAPIMRYAVPNFTETQADRRAGRVFIDLAGIFHEENLVRSRFAMLCLDDSLLYKIAPFLAKKSDATVVLRVIIASYFAPAGLKIPAIRTDNGGEFHEALQPLLASRAPDTSIRRRIRPSSTG